MRGVVLKATEPEALTVRESASAETPSGSSTIVMASRARRA
jgi:hypothetical protein